MENNPADESLSELNTKLKDINRKITKEWMELNKYEG